MWKASVLTLYPDLFPGPLGASVLGRAQADGLWGLDTVNIRDFSDNHYGSVDDTPSGGGAGLVMRADILANALDSVDRAERPVFYLSPRGKPLNIEACVRLIPGVLGSAQSLGEESFESDLLEYPHYTRPQEFEGRPIPDVLTSGNHKKIAEWRREKAIEITRTRRPDLYQRYSSKRSNPTQNKT